MVRAVPQGTTTFAHFAGLVHMHAYGLKISSSFAYREPLYLVIYKLIITPQLKYNT